MVHHVQYVHQVHHIPTSDPSHVHRIYRIPASAVSIASPHLSSPTLHGSPGDLDSLGLVCTVTDADAGRVEPSRVDAHERGGVLPVTGAAPVLAEETAGVKPAGEAERAAAAK